jgi:hypothetical protein
VATAAIAAGLTVVLVLVSRVIAGGTVGTALPPDFPVIIDVSLGVPVIGFGAADPSSGHRSFSSMATMTLRSRPRATRSAASTTSRSFFADHGYSPSELWGLGYQGDQCDLITSPTNRQGSRTRHSPTSLIYGPL